MSCTLALSGAIHTGVWCTACMRSSAYRCSVYLIDERTLHAVLVGTMRRCSHCDDERQ